MADASSSAAIKVLSLELKALKKEPVEGFQVNLPDDSNFFEWNIVIFGPPKTLYEGGYFKVRFVVAHCDRGGLSRRRTDKELFRFF